MTEESSVSVSTPGHLLRAARRRYGWSIEDIAEELNLLPHVIEGLEQDNYSVVAGHTYAVGYLRNYARLVGISIEASLQAHNALMPVRENVSGTLNEGNRVSRAMPVPISWIVSTVVALAVIVGVGLTYMNRSENGSRIALSGIATKSKVDNSNGQQTTQSEKQAGELVIDSRGNTQITRTNSAESQPNSTNVNFAENLLVPDTVLPVFDAGERIYPLADAVESKSLDQRDLVVYFIEPSWIEVRDRDAQQLIGRRVEAEQLIRLVGDPPFSIYIGSPAGVRLRYRTQNLRPEPRQGDQSVQLVVGES